MGPFILLASRYLLVVFLKRRGGNATRDSRQTLFFLVSSSGSYRIRRYPSRSVAATYYAALHITLFHFRPCKIRVLSLIFNISHIFIASVFIQCCFLFDFSLRLRQTIDTRLLLRFRLLLFHTIGHTHAHTSVSLVSSRIPQSRMYQYPNSPRYFGNFNFRQSSELLMIDNERD